MIERLNGGQVFKIPRLANGERQVVVFAGLVHAHTSRASYGNDYDARFLVLGIRSGRRRRRGVCGIFLHADVGNV